jgi:hypothetical protein
MRAARAADGSRSVISRKELARQLRRQAYQKAKAQRAVDPKHLAMKEAAKARQRELYQQIKARRKSADAEQKAKRAAKRADERAEAKATFVSQLKAALKAPAAGDEASAHDPDRASSPSLKAEIQSALKNLEVSQLMQRLRRVTEQRGVTANEGHSSCEPDPWSPPRHATERFPD